MKIETKQAINLMGRSDFYVFEDYELIQHDQSVGEIPTVVVSYAPDDKTDPEKYLKVLYKGTESATIRSIRTLAEDNTSTDCMVTASMGIAPALECSVLPGHYFYIRTSTSYFAERDALITYEDSKGVSPLLRFRNGQRIFSDYALGVRDYEGYSSLELNAVPDAMAATYEPDMDYFPVLEVVRDHYSSTQGLSRIPKDFRTAYRQQHVARGTIGDIYGEVFAPAVVDKLRERIYIPFKDGTYGVIDGSLLPEGFPIDAGLNIKENALVLMYPRKLTQLGLAVPGETVLYEPAEGEPDLKHLHVGSYKDHTDSVFISCASDTIQCQLRKSGTATSFTQRVQTISEGAFLKAPANTSVRAPYQADGYAATTDNGENLTAIFTDPDEHGRSLLRVFSETSLSLRREYYVAAPLTSKQITGTTTSGTPTSNSGDFGTLSFIMGVNDELGALVMQPIMCRIYGMDQDQYASQVLSEDLAATMDFDTVAIYDGQGSPYTSSHYFSPTINPTVMVYANLYPELPSKFKPRKDNIDIDEYESPRVIPQNVLTANRGGTLVLSPLSLDSWDKGILYNDPDYTMSLGADTDATLSTTDTGKGWDVPNWLTVLNRVSGEVKIKQKKLESNLYRDPVANTLYTYDTNPPVFENVEYPIGYFELATPEADDPYIEGDIEILTIEGKTFFRAIQYGDGEVNPSISFDYIKAIRVDRMYRTNEVDMLPVKNGKEVTFVIPPNVFMYVDGVLFVQEDITDELGSFIAPYTVTVDESVKYSFELLAPPAYDMRRSEVLRFNETEAAIVCETPAIQGMVVDELYTDTFVDLNDPTVEALYQNTLAMSSSATLTEAPEVVAERNAPQHHSASIVQTSAKEATHETVPVTQTSVLGASHASSESPNRDMPEMQKTEVEYTLPDHAIDMVDPNSESYVFDNTLTFVNTLVPVRSSEELQFEHTELPAHVAVSLEVKLDGAYFGKETLLWEPDWEEVHPTQDVGFIRMWTNTAGRQTVQFFKSWFHEETRPSKFEKPWVRTSEAELRLFEKPWSTYLKENPVFAFSWVRRNKEYVMFDVRPWVKSVKVSYPFTKEWNKYEMTVHLPEKYPFVYYETANYLNARLEAEVQARDLVSFEVRDFYKEVIDHVPSFMPRGQSNYHAFYLPDMPERYLLGSEDTHIALDGSLPGYYATQELAHQAALDAGYAEDQVTIMTQEYYPDAWIWSIRFKRVGLVAGAAEHGYVKGG